jgi:hypothetical protein
VRSNHPQLQGVAWKIWIRMIPRYECDWQQFYQTTTIPPLIVSASCIARSICFFLQSSL